MGHDEGNRALSIEQVAEITKLPYTNVARIIWDMSNRLLADRVGHVPGGNKGRYLLTEKGRRLIAEGKAAKPRPFKPTEPKKPKRPAWYTAEKVEKSGKPWEPAKTKEIKVIYPDTVKHTIQLSNYTKLEPSASSTPRRPNSDTSHLPSLVDGKRVQRGALVSLAANGPKPVNHDASGGNGRRLSA